MPINKMLSHICRLRPSPTFFTLVTIATLSTALSTVHCLADHQPDGFFACLAYHKINNFTADSDRNYQRLLYFSANNLRFTGPSVPKPKAIIIPSTKEQLANTVLCSRRASFQIRVRCGGHSYEGTSWAVSDNSPFVIIEMMNLNHVSVDVEGEVAWVQGGATLGQVYVAISQLSKVHTFSAGSCPTVGVGGHISGGGFGHLSRKYGLTADNVVDAILIDAGGRLLDYEAMGEDVFWAIRGGGGGIWGIIFAWKIRLVAVPEVVTGFKVSRSHPKHDVTNLVHKWQFVAPKMEDGFFIVAFIGANVPKTDGHLLSATFEGTYLGPREKVMSILESQFPELGITENDCKEMSYVESISFNAGQVNESEISYLTNRSFGHKTYFKAKYDYVRTPIPLSGIRAAMDMLEKQPKGTIFIEPLGGVMDEIAKDSIPFPHRKGNIYGIQYSADWEKGDDDKSEEYIEWVRELYDLMTPYVSFNPRVSYVNCMDFDLGVMEVSNGSTLDEVEMARVWGEKYFLGNYDRLVRVKTLIDPHNIFRNQQGIPPLPTTTNQQLLSTM